MAEDTAETQVSRRDFLRRSGGILAGLAGILGLANAGGLLGDSDESDARYGKSAYGGTKK
jgi:hypothetical protein